MDCKRGSGKLRRVEETLQAPLSCNGPQSHQPKCQGRNSKTREKAQQRELPKNEHHHGQLPTHLHEIKFDCCRSEIQRVKSAQPRPSAKIHKLPQSCRKPRASGHKKLPFITSCQQRGGATRQEQRFPLLQQERPKGLQLLCPKRDKLENHWAGYESIHSKTS